jgi:glycosyltransferase involved in cell wall biosynthesis
MLSVVIATHDDEHALLMTLAALVPGAAAGIVREVIVADDGSRDRTAAVADAAGCRFQMFEGTQGARLSAAAESARSDWLMFLRPGIEPDAAWVDEVPRFIAACKSRGEAARVAAVFRPARSAYALRPTLSEILALTRAALGAAPRPDQGLILSRELYRAVGGHRADAAEPERDLSRRLGRRRIVMLRCGAATPGE